MKILIISQYYPPENAFVAPTIARELSRMGHQMRVLTGYPNYPEGRIYDGFTQRWRGRECDDGIEILRVPLFIDHSQNKVRRSLNYLSFALSSASARGFALDADVIYVYATQMTPALGPWLWHLAGGAPYVLHIQDLWPDSITGSSMMDDAGGARLVDSVLTPWLRSMYQNAAAVIGIAPTMVETLVRRGSPEDRTHLVYNWAGEEALPSKTTPRDIDSGQGTSIVYAGNVGDMQDMETVVAAAHLARDTDVRLTIVGDGVALPRVKALTAKLGAGNIEFHGRIPREQMGEVYRTADYALITLKDLPTFRGTIPSKFQAALSHGVPVITTVQGDLRALVEELGVGLTSEAEDAQALASTFRAASASKKYERDKMGENAQQAYRNRFSLTSGVQEIEGILLKASQQCPLPKRGITGQPLRRNSRGVARRETPPDSTMAQHLKRLQKLS